MYLPLLWYSFQGILSEIDQRQALETNRKIEAIKEYTSVELNRNNILEVCLRLEADYLTKNITSYTVDGPDNSCHKPEGMSVKALPDMVLNKEDVLEVAGQQLIFFKSQNGPYTWAVSTQAPRKYSAWERLKMFPDLQMDLLRHLGMTVYTVFAFIFCAVLIFAQSIQNQYKKNGKNPLWLRILNKTFGKLQLHDMKILKAGTTALIQKNEELAKDIDLLETSLEFSILNTIKSKNLNLPYTFLGTVSKVDINGFSKVVASQHTQTSYAMTSRLEDFGCELLLRYEGLFEKSIGDEIVVVFTQPDSLLRAAAFSRDLMREFSEIKFNIGTEERTFTLKSAIYSSEINFNKRTAGYGFLGESLTFTTRLMDAVHIKDRNILSVNAPTAQRIQSLVNLPNQTEVFHFKNMPDQEGYLIDNFLSVEKIIKINPSLLSYFRSDDDILFLLGQLNENSISIETKDSILTALSMIKIKNSKKIILTEWLQLIKNQSHYSNNELAKIISLANNLIPQQNWSEEATQVLLSVPRNRDGRINATIIEVLMNKDIPTLRTIDQNTFIIKDDPSGRTQGNILVFKSLIALNDSIFQELIQMIKSKNTDISKSGIYSACQIISFYKEKNPAALEVYKGYMNLVEILIHIKKSKVIKLSDRVNSQLNKLTF